jgi:gas vesicle protein
MQKTNHFATFLAGLGVGAAAGILLAPASGDQTRDKIGDLANRTSDALKDRAESFGSAVGAAKNAANKVVDQSRDVVHGVGRSMEEKGKQLQAV